MDGFDWLLGLSLVAIAGLTRGLSGFGSAMILAPGLSLIFTPQQVVATVILLETSASIGLTAEALPNTNWREVLPMAIAAICTIPVGVYFLVLLNPDLMGRIIGGLILAFVVLLFLSKHAHIKTSVAASSWVGAMSGFLTGLTGMGGPPVVLYEMAGDGTAVGNRANWIIFLALTQFVALITYFFKGLLSTWVFQHFLLFLPVFLVGLILGKSLFKWVDEKSFRNLVLGLLLVISTFALLT